MDSCTPHSPFLSSSIRSRRDPGQLPFGGPASPPEEKSPDWLSRILFKCGLQLKTLNTPETLRDRLRQGEVVRKDFLQRRSRGTAFAGLSRQALLEQLPNCDCVLEDIFIELFGLKQDD